MNAQTNVRQHPDQPDQEHGERVILIDTDAPIGLPGEAAPEITLAEDEGQDEEKPAASQGFGGVLVNIRDAFSLRKTTKPTTTKPEDHEGLDVEPKPEGHVGLEVDLSEGAAQSGVEGLSEKTEGKEAEAGSEIKANPRKMTDPRLLLGGLAAAAVVAATAGVMLWPLTPTKPVVAEQGIAGHPAVLAPAASLASVPKPEIASPPERPAKKSGDPLQEILALKPQNAMPASKDGAAKPVEEKATPLKDAAQKLAQLEDGAQKVGAAASVAENPNAILPAAPSEGAPRQEAPRQEAPRQEVSGEPSPTAAARLIVPETRPQSVAEVGLVTGKPDGHVDVARSQVAPVKEPQSIQQDRLEAIRSQTALLERVTQLAALVAHLNSQINRIEGAQTKLATGAEEHFADLQRRMALAESNNQLNAAAKAQDARQLQSLGASNAAEAKPPARIILKTGKAAAPAESMDDKRAYRVQAASPSLAMLGTGDNEPPLEVSPGATIPGWGRVSKIEQRGQAWVVVTSGGVIQ